MGSVEHVTYHDPGSGFSVLRFAPETGYDPPQRRELFASNTYTAVGHAPEVLPGMRATLTGHWDDHRTHGLQFRFEALEPLNPVDERGLERYLASKAFPGIGETLAKRIVAKLGTEALDRIQEDPTLLHGIRGLKPNVASDLTEAVRSQLSAHRTRAYLRGLGLGPMTAQAVLARLGPDCQPRLERDPYLLATVPGVGFATADAAAREAGLAIDDERRLAAGLHFALSSASKEGHTCLSPAVLFAQATQLLGTQAEPGALRAALERLVDDDSLVVDDLAPGGLTEDGEPGPVGDERVYLPWLFASERGLARNLAQLLTADDVPALSDPRLFERAEAAAEIELHESQREALRNLLATPVGLLTGGPGVGKTTLVRLVANIAEDAGSTILLASPTGRAAKRLAEATGRPASTIHRMLRYDPETSGFAHGPDKPLDAGLVLVDEISMLDVVLAHHLVKAIRPPTRLVLVGDPDLLPSVGAGAVLADLIDSGTVPVSRLSHIYRQSESSLIVANAHRILAGELPELPGRGVRDADFYLFPADDPAQAAKLLVDVVTRRIPETFGHRWDTDVQVIAPMYRGECGVDNLNELLREALGVGGREVTRGNRTWRVGDRVIHVRNDYEKQVFNGDMGFIASISADGEVTVRFPEQDVVYAGSELSDLHPAFAITVHRSQGGEFPVVVVPLVTQHFMMLQRNLLYTAITRARQLVVLVGSRQALQMAVDNVRTRDRVSGLRERLERLCPRREHAE